MNIPAYSLTWKESNGPWQEAWPANKLPNLSGIQKHALTGLKCGTKYSLRITATNRVGTSQPAYLDVITVGGGNTLLIILIRVPLKYVHPYLCEPL